MFQPGTPQTKGIMPNRNMAQLNVHHAGSVSREHCGEAGTSMTCQHPHHADVAALIAGLGAQA